GGGNRRRAGAGGGPGIPLARHRIRQAGLRGPGDFFFSSRRRHTSSDRDWSSDVCSSDLFGLLTPVRMWSVPDPFSPMWALLAVSVPVSAVWIYLVARDGRGAIFTREIDNPLLPVGLRSEERRVGKECRSRWGRCQ